MVEHGCGKEKGTDFFCVSWRVKGLKSGRSSVMINKEKRRKAKRKERRNGFHVMRKMRETAGGAFLQLRRRFQRGEQKLRHGAAGDQQGGDDHHLQTNLADTLFIRYIRPGR